MRTLLWLPYILGTIGPAVIPSIHITVLWFYWQNYSRFVDRRFCSCSCWDTVFKGTYETGIASYKHMYFNATRNTLKIWILTVTAIILLYESIKYLVRLMTLRMVRWSMVLLFCLSVFSHYYAWWACVNYYNDDFYSQWNHQLFFTITELISTGCVLHMANTERYVTLRKTLCIVGIALLHIVASGRDQFISNVLRGEGFLHQIIRDLSFMIPDLMHLLVPIWLWRSERRSNYIIKSTKRDTKVRHDVISMLLIVTVLLIICSML